MRTWIDTSYELNERDLDMLCVTAHAHCVTLHLPAVASAPPSHGFSLTFLPAHLPRLRELVNALEALAEG